MNIVVLRFSYFFIDSINCYLKGLRVVQFRVIRLVISNFKFRQIKLLKLCFPQSNYHY